MELITKFYAVNLNYAKNKLKERVRHQPIGFELLPKEFTLSDIQNLYESVLEINLDKRNFRKTQQKKIYRKRAY